MLFLLIIFTDADEEDDFKINTKFPLSDYLFADSKDKTDLSNNPQNQSNDSIDKVLKEVTKQVQEENTQISQNYHKDKDGNIVDANGDIVLPKEKIIVINPNSSSQANKNHQEANSSHSNKNASNKKSKSSNTQFNYKTASAIDKERLSQLAKRFESIGLNPSDSDFKDKVNRNIEYGADSFSNFDKKDEASNEHKLLRTITADKMIPAILITPISSQIEGNKVVAQVESDIYASMGRAVLIPKGSRAIGFYNSNNKIGEYRLEVVWNRIITPQGINIILTNAKGADVKGYAGLVGNLHNKYWEKYGLPLTLSTLSNGLLLAISSGLSTQLNKSSNGAGVYQSYQTAQLVGQMKDDVSNIIQQILREQIRIKPIITIKEGSRIFISPNVDIFFPEPKDGEVLTEFFKEYEPLPKDDDISDEDNEY
ncbi:hypothetical protein BKH41_04105 [Helicobacter sp. 12S02232-10]|nr:hypothetical protein BKH41_04105 [Helicobacter sp. 12S02232-10]